jgi:serine/threonine protein kinase
MLVLQQPHTLSNTHTHTHTHTRFLLLTLNLDSCMQAQSPIQLLTLIEEAPQVPLPAACSSLTPGCRSLLLRLLEKNPARRISWNDFFSDPWLCQDCPPLIHVEPPAGQMTRQNSDLSNLLSITTAFSSTSTPISMEHIGSSSGLQKSTVCIALHCIALLTISVLTIFVGGVLVVDRLV